MGFSPFGLAVAVAVLAPNLLFLRFPPRGALPVAVVPIVLTGVERAGQALCLVVPPITAAGGLSWWWLPAVILTIVGYWALWGRYLLTGRTAADLYRPLWKVPVPMAILPVLTFLTTAAWLSNPWIAGAAMILAAGHIPASLIRASAVDMPV